MSNIRRAEYTANGNQEYIEFDTYRLPFQVGVYVDIVSGSAAYKLEYSVDEAGQYANTMRWHALSNTITANTTSNDMSIFAITYPISALRMANLACDGTVYMTSIQPVGTTIR